PTISVEKEQAKLSHVTTECIRFCVLGLLPFDVMMLLAGKLLIRLGYSTRFLSISPWLSWQMSAEVVAQAFGVIAMLLLGINSLRLYGAMVGGQSLLFLWLGLWACNIYGAIGVIYAQLAAGCVALAISMYIIDRFLGLKMDKSLLVLVPSVICCLLGLGW